jgi:uncharacterized membrane protein YvlD (DUF360 family)
MTGFGVLWPLIRLLLDTVVLRILAGIVPGLRIDTWGTAFTAVLVLTVAGWISGPLLGLLPESGFWLFVLIEFVVTTILLGLTALFLDGMEFRGFGALILAGALFTVIEFAPFVLGPQVRRFVASE